MYMVLGYGNTIHICWMKLLLLSNCLEGAPMGLALKFGKEGRLSFSAGGQLDLHGI
jgi:hypothetical protein